MIHRRTFLGTATAAMLAAAVSPIRAAERFDAIIGAADGSGTPAYPSLQAALDAQTKSPYRVLLRAGRWVEKLTIRKPGLQLIGEDRQTSILTFDTAAGQLNAEGKPMGTAGTATLTVLAPDCLFHNLTIANHFDYLGAIATQKYPGIGPNGAQALAVMLGQGADRSWFHQVDILGHQDTLFVDAGTSLFEQARITGSVDFIYGAGRVLFKDCEIVSRFRPGLQRNHGFITAPSTNRAEKFGLVFRHCRLTREAEVPMASVVLGRPYRPRRQFADGAYGDPDAVGAATFLQCWMDDHISADGWDEMFYSTADGSRTALAPQQARFAEYDSEGPGAFQNRRRPWLNRQDAALYSEQAVLGPWHPDPTVLS
jgi:pectinesterase